MKETDFPTKNCRSAKKITQLKTTIEKQRQRDVRGWNVHLPHQKVLYTIVFASWIRRDLIKTRLIFSRINGPNVDFAYWGWPEYPKKIHDFQQSVYSFHS